MFGLRRFYVPVIQTSKEAENIGLDLIRIILGLGLLGLRPFEKDLCRLWLPTIKHCDSTEDTIEKTRF